MEVRPRNASHVNTSAESSRLGARAGSSSAKLRSQAAAAGVALAVAAFGIMAASCVSSSQKTDRISPVPRLAERDQATRDKPSIDRNKVTRASLPTYPMSARKNGVGGYVIVQFSLSDDGHPTEEVVVASEPKDVFEKSCIAAVKRLHYNMPADWAAQNPGHRDEYACVYEVIGSPNQPSLRDFPSMNYVIASTR
jgi:TonB family protein